MAIKPDPLVNDELTKQMAKRRFDTPQSMTAAMTNATLGRTPSPSLTPPPVVPAATITALDPKPPTVDRVNAAAQPSPDQVNVGPPAELRGAARRTGVPGIYEGARGYHGERVFSDNQFDPVLGDRGDPNGKYKFAAPDQSTYDATVSALRRGAKAEQLPAGTDAGQIAAQKAALAETRVERGVGYDPSNYVASHGESELPLDRQVLAANRRSRDLEDTLKALQVQSQIASGAAARDDKLEDNRRQEQQRVDKRIAELTDNATKTGEAAAFGLDPDSFATLIAASENPDNKELEIKARGLLEGKLNAGLNNERGPVDKGRTFFGLGPAQEPFSDTNPNEGVDLGGYEFGSPGFLHSGLYGGSSAILGRAQRRDATIDPNGNGERNYAYLDSPDLAFLNHPAINRQFRNYVEADRRKKKQKKQTEQK